MKLENTLMDVACGKSLALEKGGGGILIRGEIVKVRKWEVMDEAVGFVFCDWCVGAGSELDTLLAEAQTKISKYEIEQSETHYHCQTCRERRALLRELYRCYGCKGYFCNTCAPKHFKGNALECL